MGELARYSNQIKDLSSDENERILNMQQKIIIERTLKFTRVHAHYETEE